MAAARGLQSARNILVLAYADDVIDDEEFLLLHEQNLSRQLFPYWKFNRFDLDTWDNVQCNSELRFKKEDIFRLYNVLEIPEKVICEQRSICSGIEALCILLKRLAFPCRYVDMVTTFGRSQFELCLIFNKALDYVYDNHHHRLDNFNQPILQPQALKLYADKINAKGAPLDNCFGFIDGTVCAISRPKINQRVVYNGHKRVHALKFQSIALPNGLIGSLQGPYEGRRHDSTMLFQSGVLRDMQVNAFYNGDPFCIYGDYAYPLSVHIQTPFQGANLTQDQHSYNSRMKTVRVSVEWLFGDIKNYFKFIDWRKVLKIGLSPVGKQFLVSGLLQNAKTCLYGNITSDFFDLEPPTLEEYFQ